MPQPKICCFMDHPVLVKPCLPRNWLCNLVLSMLSWLDQILHLWVILLLLNFKIYLIGPSSKRLEWSCLLMKLMPSSDQETALRCLSKCVILSTHSSTELVPHLKESSSSSPQINLSNSIPPFIVELMRLLVSDNQVSLREEICWCTIY